MSIPMAVPDRVEVPPMLDRLVAVATLAVATALVHTAPFRCTLGLSRAAKRCASRPATAGEAQSAVAARD